jgi:hypothetical protein
MRALRKLGRSPGSQESVAVSPSDSGPSPVDAELAEMERLGLDELRLQWRNRWGRLAPAHLSRGLLFRVMAYRVQAETSGDLDRQTAKLLDRLAQEAGRQRPVEGAAEDQANTRIPRASKAKTLEPMPTLKPGALLTREWQGRMERVMALEQGFAWNGKTYGSLSAAAFAITGVKWNGRRFFLAGGARGEAGRIDRGKDKQLGIDERRGTSRPPRPLEARR